ncbi:MAG: cytochrome c3 family protein, partial [Novosphingobium sp.]|uniref:cytochrome c3 family protein n=1 Tax=Novosphingobium sp. TaxID=1874826 RepID=UPI0032B7CAF6
HNGTNATGKAPTHPGTTNLCQNCHTSTTSWQNYRMNHAEVAGRCDSCHNGRIAEGKPRDHPTTSQDCGACHNTRSWD